VIKQKARKTDEIHPKAINVQRHRCFPEEPAREPWLHGFSSANANVLTVSDPETIDPVTGG